MDRLEKKRLQKEYAAKQRKEFEDSLPMSKELFLELFDYLNIQSEEHDCQHNFDMTITFLKNNNCPLEPVLKWLRENGAGCDCEIIFNIEETFE